MNGRNVYANASVDSLSYATIQPFNVLNTEFINISYTRHSCISASTEQATALQTNLSHIISYNSLFERIGEDGNFHADFRTMWCVFIS